MVEITSRFEQCYSQTCVALFSSVIVKLIVSLSIFYMLQN